MLSSEMFGSNVFFVSLGSLLALIAIADLVSDRWRIATTASPARQKIPSNGWLGSEPAFFGYAFHPSTGKQNHHLKIGEAATVFGHTTGERLRDADISV